MRQTTILILSLFITSICDAQFVFLGDAQQISSTCAEVTPNDFNQKGWVYSSDKVDLSQKQELTYEINLGTDDNGADGMVFMLHNDPRGLFAQGCVGESMGFANHPSGPNSGQCGNGSWYAIEPSIAVEFDTYRNGSQGDPTDDHIAFLENGSVNHGSNFISVPNIEDGLDHTFVFLWNPSTQLMQVSFDGSIIMSQTKDIINATFGGETMVYLGFSASTGGARNTHRICFVETGTSIKDNITIVDGDWNQASTWLKNVPTSTEDVIVAHNVTVTANATVGGVTINPDATIDLTSNDLTLSVGDLTLKGEVISDGGEIAFTSPTSQAILLPNGSKNIDNIRLDGLELNIQSNRLNVMGYLNVASGTVNTNNLLTLASTSTTTGRILDLSNGTINGNVTMERDLSSDFDIWRYLASPFSNSLLLDLEATFPITGILSNGLPGPYIYYYNEAELNTFEYGYISFANILSPLDIGKGYATFIRRGNHNMSLTGTINSGQQDINLSYSNSGSADDDGWNLIGNPYPCTIDWTNLSRRDRRRIDNAVYYNDNTSGTLVQRSFVNGVGNPAGTTGQIASFQGFWVHATRAGARVRFNENDKVNLSSNYYRTAQPKLIRVRISDTNINESETVIRIEDSATTSFDAEYDAYLFSKNGLTINTLDNELKEMSINSINSNSTEQIKLQIQNFRLGTHKLTFFEKSWEIDDVFLVDNFTNTETLISEGFEYEFDVTSNPTSINDRFEIKFGKSVITALNNVIENNSLHIYPNPVIQGEKVSADVTIKSYYIYDANGLLVEEQKNVAENTINTDNLKKGFYLAKIVSSENKTFNSKLVIH